MNYISSGENKYIKLAHSLKNKKYRDKYSMFFDEGIKNIELSLQSYYKIRYVFVREDFKNHGLVSKICKKVDENNIFLLNKALFSKISDTVNPQGLLAIYEKKDSSYQEANNVLILDRLQDPGNIGTIIRTAEAMGIVNIYYIKGTADFFSPKSVRASMGSIYFVNINLLEDVDYLKNKGYKIYATCLKDSLSCVNAFTDEKTALIIANEANGISDELLDKSDKKIRIEMKGMAESLNAAVATSMLVYEMTRNKK